MAAEDLQPIYSVVINFPIENFADIILLYSSLIFSLKLKEQQNIQYIHVHQFCKVNFLN